ncbi:hypothetical protein DV736_g882, partial [Chaetothyriales sp. CBS 134916]
MSRERFAAQSLGIARRRAAEAKVLVVGAGGIGCELLKNVVLTGFGEVHMVDLDTIDLSNLNRQFLFRHEHIKKPKAIVAREVAQQFNPKVKLVAHHANIKEPRFNVDWFSRFTLVFNALDNLEARRHVNKMCLAADVPLIESGTTGFNGQVQVIKKGLTACYDCAPKTTPKSYPVCTIRSTPSQAIHCIVWAKSYLLPELFGEAEDVAPELDKTEDSENTQEIAKLKEEAEALQAIRASMGSDTFAKQVFDKVFKDDIERLAKMEDMWKDRPAPEPLSFESLASEPHDMAPSIAHEDQNTWTTADNFVVFRDSLSRLAKRLARDKAAAMQSGLPSPTITFDKDDDDTLDFVTATANLRAQIFGIEAKSKFDTKQMAGNIIPAIATTNAMIAGLCVMQSFKVLRGDYAKNKMVYLDRGNMSATSPDSPNPYCVVCSAAMARVQIDADKATLKNLVEDVLKTKLSYGDEISILSDKGLIYDPDLEDNLDKTLAALGVGEGSTLTIQDEADDDDEESRVDLRLFIELSKADADAIVPAVQLVLKEGELLNIPRKARKAQRDALLVNGNGSMESSHGTVPEASGKRKRDAEEADVDKAVTAKKVQVSRPSEKGEGLTVIVDDDDGAIVLDDD